MGFWVAFAVSVAISVISYLLTPKPEMSNPAAAEDLDVPAPKEGESIMMIFGMPKITSASVTWYGDIKAEAIKKKGGKK